MFMEQLMALDAFGSGTMRIAVRNTSPMSEQLLSLLETWGKIFARAIVVSLV